MQKNKTDTRNVRIRQYRKSSIKPPAPPPPILVLIFHKKIND